MHHKNTFDATNPLGQIVGGILLFIGAIFFGVVWIVFEVISHIYSALTIPLESKKIRIVRYHRQERWVIPGTFVFRRSRRKTECVTLKGVRFKNLPSSIEAPEDCSSFMITGIELDPPFIPSANLVVTELVWNQKGGYLRKLHGPDRPVRKARYANLMPSGAILAYL